MRQVKNALLVLFTLALVAIGAVMPFAASRWQDAKQTGAEVRSFDSFLLTLKKKGELGQILRFFYENTYYMFVDDKEADAVLSEAEALDAAAEAIEAMARYGIIEDIVLDAFRNPAAVGIEEGPNVYMSCVCPEIGEIEESHMIWMIDWPELEIQFWLDDASGKMIQAYFPRTGYIGKGQYDAVSSTPRAAEDYYAEMDNWCIFLREYYEMEIPSVEEIPYAYPQGYLLFIDLEDGGELLPMQLYLHDDWASFEPGHTDTADE